MHNEHASPHTLAGCSQEKRYEQNKSAGEEERLDADVEAAKQARYISAFEPQVSDLNAKADTGTQEVVALLAQLQDLEQAAQRSVAAEMETTLEGNPALVDEAGATFVKRWPCGTMPKCNHAAAQNSAHTRLEYLLP